MFGEHFHPRIYPANYPLLDRFEPNHPALRALQVHAESLDVCVGKEIEWPKEGNVAIEQSCFSEARQKQLLFSSIAYELLSYALVLDGWLRMPVEPTDNEVGFLSEDFPLLHDLLYECEQAAMDEGNAAMLPLIAKAREYTEAHKAALLLRFEECGIEWAES